MALPLRNRFTVLGENRVMTPQPRPRSTPQPEPLLICTKSYFKLLQSLHHLEILEKCLVEGAGPPGMTRKVRKLAAFIRPAAPNPEITKRVAAHTHRWLMENLSALRDHYTNLCESIIPTLGPFNSEASEKAIRWARLRYGKKLTPTSIDMFKTRLLITNRTPAIVPTGPAVAPASASPSPSRPAATSAEDEDWPQLPPPASRGLPPRTAKRAVNRTWPSPSPPPSVSEPPPSALPHHLSPNTIAPLGERDLPEASGPVAPPVPSSSGSAPIRDAGELTPNPVDTHRQHTDEQTQHTTAHTHPQPPVAFSPVAPSFHIVLEPDFSFSLVSPAPEPPVTQAVATPQPVLQPANRALFSPPAAPPAPLTPSATSTPCSDRKSPTRQSPAPPPHSGSQSSSHHLPATPNGSSLRAVGPRLETPPPPVAASTSRPSTPGSANGRLSLSKRRLSAQGNDPMGWEPVRHPKSKRKAAQWDIHIRKPIVFLGDSNLARIPAFKHPQIQVDSYPGMQLDHLQAIIAKLDRPNRMPTKLVLSVGIINCEKQNSEITLRKALRKLLRTATYTFPCAKVFVLLLNCSPLLSVHTRRTVDLFNSLVMENSNYLTEINSLLFKTPQDDPIHWTPQTAQRLFDAWRDELNY